MWSQVIKCAKLCGMSKPQGLKVLQLVFIIMRYDLEDILNKNIEKLYIRIRKQ